MSKCNAYSTLIKIHNSAIIQWNADVKDNTGLQNLKNSSNAVMIIKKRKH